MKLFTLFCVMWHASCVLVLDRHLLLHVLLVRRWHSKNPVSLKRMQCWMVRLPVPTVLWRHCMKRLAKWIMMYKNGVFCFTVIMTWVNCVLTVLMPLTTAVTVAHFSSDIQQLIMIIFPHIWLATYNHIEAQNKTPLVKSPTEHNDSHTLHDGISLTSAKR